jgi:hypothetical protein
MLEAMGFGAWDTAAPSPGGARRSQGKSHFIERESCPNHEGRVGSQSRFALFNIKRDPAESKSAVPLNYLPNPMEGEGR